MTSVVILILILILGYLIINSVSRLYLSKHSIFVGIEYLFLGIIISPAFSNWIRSTFNLSYPQVINPEFLSQLNPLITASVGFIGFTYGLKFNLGNIHRSSSENVKLGIYSIISPLVVISLPTFFILSYFYGAASFRTVLSTSLALGLFGALSSNQVIESIAKKYNISGKISETLRKGTLLNINFTVFLFGLFFGINYPFESLIKLTSTEWILVSSSISFIIGVSFFIFLGREDDDNFLFASVLGIVIFTSGLAYFLGTSSLFMNLIVGMIMANLSKQREKVDQVLTEMLKPFLSFTILMAGVFWMPPNLTVFIAAVFFFIFLRFVANRITGFWVYMISYDKTQTHPQINKGILPIDIVVCAMVLDYIRVFNNEFTPLVVTAALCSLLFFTASGYLTTKNFLIDAGEITRETL